MQETTKWLDVHGAGRRAGVGHKLIYRAVKAGDLRATRIGGRRELRFLPEWVDEWLLKSQRIASQSKPGVAGLIR